MSGIKSMDELRDKIAALDDASEVEETSVEEVVEETKEEAPVEEVVEETKEDVEAPVEEVVEETKEEVEAPLEEESSEEVSEVEAFVPEKTYKSLGEEKEYDEFLINSVKTPEQMDTLKRLYQKSNGLDHYQMRNTELKQTNENLVSENGSYKNEMSFYNKLLQKGDHHTLFRSINISDDDVLKVAQNILQYSELTPTQQQAYDSNIVNNQNVYNLESENQRLQEEVQNREVETQIQALDNYLLGDTVSNTVNAFDQRIGRIGAFKSEVINRAAMVEKSTGKVLSMEDAVTEVLNLVGHAQAAPIPVGETGNTPRIQPQNRVVVKKSNPTLPNIKAGAHSPAKKVVKSLADLRKIADGLDPY